MNLTHVVFFKTHTNMRTLVHTHTAPWAGLLVQADMTVIPQRVSMEILPPPPPLSDPGLAGERASR